MNKAILVGRLTKDPEVKLTSNQTQFCQFTVAVERKFKDQNGQRQVDFINCLAWKNTAIFIQKYFHKGNRIGLTGNIQTRSYEDNNGQKKFVTEIVVEEVEFVENNNKADENTTTAPVEDPVQTEAVGESVSGELPFEI